jgi:hypothetical protein
MGSPPRQILKSSESRAHASTEILAGDLQFGGQYGTVV